VALFSMKYPDGDRGGNSIRIRIASSPTNLHSFWDGLLGRGTTAGNIGKDVAEIEAVMKDKAETIKSDMEAHKTPESWAKEGAALAPKAVYLDGELLKPREGSTDDVLQAPPEYAPACGRVARMQVGKAGMRLAGTLSDLFNPVPPAKQPVAVPASLVGKYYQGDGFATNPKCPLRLARRQAVHVTATPAHTSEQASLYDQGVPRFAMAGVAGSCQCRDHDELHRQQVIHCKSHIVAGLGLVKLLTS
jgi:S1/P1 Nuclease